MGCQFLPERKVTEVQVITLPENLYPNCPNVYIKGTTLESVLDHHSRLVPVYDECQGDVDRAIRYIEEKKAEYED